MRRRTSRRGVARPGTLASMRGASWWRELEGLRGAFGAAAVRRKRALLRRAARDPLRDPRVLRVYHDHLLFMLAYPDDAEIRRRVETELRRVAGVVGARLGRRRGAGPAAWRDSGIAGTTLTHGFSLDLTRWLCRRFGRDVTLIWPGRARLAALEALLPALMPRVERDGFLSPELSTREWLRLAEGPGPTRDMAWLAERLAQVPAPPAVLDQVVDSLALSQRWTLRRRLASSTFQRFPPRPIHYQTAPLRRRDDVMTALRAPVPPGRALPLGRARALTDVSRAALTLRQRETDPMTYTNLREVRLVRLERGIDVAVFGLSRERRLPIESYFGYTAAKNRVPAAYGGAWIFGDRAEIGLNIFETARGGESAYLFGQIMRAYRALFRVRRFVVEPYQIGEDNEEAIESGAFWFYYRLGFRPAQPALARLAAREWDRLAAASGRRTSAGTLRRLARSRLGLEVTPRRRGDPETPDLVRLSLGVTRAVGRRFGGDRTAAQAWAVRRIQQVLGVRSTARWPPAERAAFEELGLLAALCPDLSTWGLADKRTLVALLRAKGGVEERPFARQLPRHRRFWAWLSTLAARLA